MGTITNILDGGKPSVSMLIVAMTLLSFASACQGTAVVRSASAEESAPTTVAEQKAGDGAAADDAASTPYTVECSVDDAKGKRTCAVDRGTFIGWRTYHGFCHVCHAQDAVGSTFAPSLVDRMQDINYDLFVERTAGGYTGQVGVMPPWKDNPNVSKKYKELFAYLKARSDGILPGGRPGKLPKKE